MHTKIWDFIRQSHLLSFGVQEGGKVYVASCFYAFDEERLALIFKSASHSKHIVLANQNPWIGVSIAHDTKVLKQIKGVQIQAKFQDASLYQEQIYYQCYPFAVLMEGGVFALEIAWIKYTDNQLLLKKKIEWSRDNDGNGNEL